MSRVKKGISAHKRRGYVLERTKGFIHGRSTKFRQAKEALLHADSYAYRDRRNRKREFRALWIVRLNNALRLVNPDLSYSKFINIIKDKTELNRKMLSELAIRDEAAFAALVTELTK
jgi:large subunit ribosomal protein L20